MPIPTETSENSEVASIRDITKIGRQNDAEQVIIDEPNSKPFVHDKTFLSEQLQNTLNSQEEVGVIAYWRKDKTEAFHCYHYFYIPKPCKRLMRHSMRKLVN